jgi:UDP-2,3-diacylglucosamine hydrolase
MLAWVVLRAVLADLHLGQRAGDLNRFAKAVEEILRRGVGEVTLLGDVCVALVGFPHFWDEVVTETLGQLGRLVASGVRTVVVEGNRDFFLQEPALGDAITTAGQVHSFVAGGRRFLLEHGDQINRHDRRYLFWRSLSKSPVSRAWARVLPGALARRIVHGTEQRLRRTNFSYRVSLPVELLQAAARRHFAAGIDVVLWGHFHRPWRLREGTAQAFVLPGWLEHAAILWVAEDGALSVGQEQDGQFVDTPVPSWYEVRESSTEAS